MSVALESKNRINALISAANEATGNTDADLTSAINALIGGFGQGGGENLLDYATSLARMFMQNTFPDGTELEVCFGSKATDVDSINPFSYMAYKTSGLKSVKVKYEGSQTLVLNLGNMFDSASRTTLEMVDLRGLSQPLNVTNMNRTVYECNTLREIIGTFDGTNCTSFANAFIGCRALESVRFTPNTVFIALSFVHSSKLSDESIQSIIDGLADLTGGTAQTLTFHADVGAKLTDEQKAAVSAKNWTLAY